MPEVKTASHPLQVPTGLSVSHSLFHFSTSTSFAPLTGDRMFVSQFHLSLQNIDLGRLAQMQLPQIGTGVQSLPTHANGMTIVLTLLVFFSFYHTVQFPFQSSSGGGFAPSPINVRFSSLFFTFVFVFVFDSVCPFSPSTPKRFRFHRE
jgi:hypothetical protein